MKNLSTIILVLIFNIVLSIVNFKEDASEKAPLTYKSYYDLLGITVECKYKGALKNFAIKTDSKNVWYTFGCYSSITDSNEYDESILKGLYITSSSTFQYSTTQSLESLGKVNIKCPVDYALSKFTINKNQNNNLVVDYGCVGVKTIYQTKDNSIKSSGSFDGPATSLTPLDGLTCGDNTIETEEIPGTPLRGFKFSITSKDSTTVNAQYLYSYHKLRSIENDKKKWAQKTEKLRNDNDQKN